MTICIIFLRDIFRFKPRAAGKHPLFPDANKFMPPKIKDAPLIASGASWSHNKDGMFSASSRLQNWPFQHRNGYDNTAATE